MDLRTTKSLLRKYRVRPNKLRGQSFLVDERAAARIVEAAGIAPQETVLEIGPGLAALTTGLLERAHRVIAVEIDPRLCALLKAELGERSELEVLNEDFRRVDIAQAAARAGAGGLKIVGNLPYQITGLALRMILDHMHLLSGALITVQREVADRMLSSPGSKSFGALSVAAQYHSHPRAVLRLPASSFYPRPEVSSTTVFLQPRPEPPVRVIDEALFFSLIKALFGHRRKTAKNALRSRADLHLTSEQMELLSRQSSVDLDRRAETMNLQELSQICNIIWELQHA